MNPHLFRDAAATTMAIADPRLATPLLGHRTFTLDRAGAHPAGVRFSTGSVYEILTFSTYYGQHHFNRRDSRTGAPRPPSQWVGVQVPAIIDEATFNEVQAS
jgi:Recombinase